MNNLPPGTSLRDIDGPQCCQCGSHGECDCPEDDGTLTYRERQQEMKADDDRNGE